MTGEYYDRESLLAARSGDQEALERVVASNLGLVKSIALRFTGRGVELEDLIQLGTLGMLKAIRGFDETRDCRFSTYAVPHIMGEIRRFFRDDGQVKVSRGLKVQAAKLYRASEEYEKRHGKEPSLEFLCEKTGISREEATLALGACRPALSLYGDEEREERELLSFLGEDPTEGIVSSLALDQALETLAPEEQRLVRLRYFKGLTQVQTARLMNCSQVKVSRWEKEILSKLRTLLGEGGKMEKKGGKKRKNLDKSEG